MAEKIDFDLGVGKNELDKALASSQKQATLLQKSLDTATGFFISNVAIKSIDGIGAALKGSVNDARNFSRGIAEINSILPKNKKLTDETTNSFIELSKSYGSDAQTQAKAFYNIVSAGVQGTRNQLDTLKVSNEAATAGLVDINTSATVLVSSVNAYAKAGLTATQASDSLFQAVKDGQTTFQELSASLGQVAPLASSANVSFQDLNGTIAFLTASGIKTPQAITGIRAALTALIKPTQEAKDQAAALGLEFGVEGIKKAGGFAEFLGRVREATNGNTTAISKLFGSVEATNAVLAVAGGNFQKFTELIDNNRKSLGATAEAANEVKKSLDFQLGQLESEGKALALTFGNLLVPAIQDFAKGLKLISSVFKENNDEYAAQREQLSKLGAEYNAVTGAINSIRRGIQFQEAGGLKASEESLQRLASLEERRNAILKERQNLRTFITSTPNAPKEDDAAKNIEAERVNAQKIIDINIERDQKLRELRGQFALDEQNSRQEQLNAGIENEFAKNDAELQRIIEFDTQKKELEFQLAEQRAANISDETEKRIELARIAAQRELDFSKIANQNLLKEEDATAKKRLAIINAANANEQRAYQTRTNYISAAATLGAAVAKDGSVTQFAIQKASALASIALERARAIAAIPAQTAILPAPAVPPAAASLLANANSAFALGLAGIAASSIQQFENGGFVGGMNGASIGSDNRVATLREGEFVLNGTDQKILSDAIKSGNLGGGDIVVQIDGREIFRAVRNQLKQGMKFI